jgi:hypothetical protein
MAKGYQWISQKFKELGGDDKIAKGPQLAGALGKHLIVTFGKKKPMRGKK